MQYLLPFILAMAVTMAWLPLFVRLANRWLFIDQPGERKVHSIPIPRVGGLAMAAGVLVAALLTIRLQAQDRWFLFAAAVLIVFGALDDRFDLDYRLKLLGQLIAVSIVVLLGGVQVHSLTFSDPVVLPDWLAMPLSVFFLVGVTNAINLADGLDGLAGGTTFLCLCAVALLSSVGDPGAATALACAFAGAVLGFLRFNTYPASVFMGDAGSQLLGFTIGVLSVRATQGVSSQVSAALPVLLLALPILDTLSVMAQRVGEGRSPFSADKNHIHHKLLALGFDHHEAVMVIYTVQACLFVAAYFLRYESDLLILAVVGAFFAASLVAFQVAERRGWRLRRLPRSSRAAPDSKVSLAVELSRLLPRYSYAALAIALATFAALIVLETSTLKSDMQILAITLAVMVGGFLVFRRTAPIMFLEKGVLFVSGTMLVYLEAINTAADQSFPVLTWAAVLVVGAASAVRLRQFNDRRFELTPLDLIVLFMALVVPSLLGNGRLPHVGAQAIAKLVILLYGIEMLVTRSEQRAVWVRVVAALVLAALVLRSAGYA
jgi:UDP-GlcNAc:undecaprenyl-phosphate GlcNAc-1-phosphate transferase